MTAGDAYTCALTIAGGVLCWGNNEVGQLGTRGNDRTSIPVAVSGLSSGSSTLSAGAAHTCALTTAGGVLCWGDNSYGQLGIGSTDRTNVPVAVSGLSSGVSALSAGYGHTCALTTTGGVLCWGSHFPNGDVVESTVPVAVSGLSSGVSAVSAGDFYTCALTTAGGVLCWGDNAAGQLGTGSTTADSNVPVVSGLSSGVSAISAGKRHVCAVTTVGSVLCWGANQRGQVGILYSTSSPYPVAVSGLSSEVSAVSAGGYHTCALTTAGGVLCWGVQPANGGADDSYVPVAVSGLRSGVSAVSAGDYHTCALPIAGGVLCWGSNSSGQLGDGSVWHTLPGEVLAPSTPTPTFVPTAVTATFVPAEVTAVLPSATPTFTPTPTSTVVTILLPVIVNASTPTPPVTETPVPSRPHQ